MFADLKKEYDERRKELKARIQVSKKEMGRLAEPLASHILNGLNSQVELLHQNQKNIEVKAKKYRQESGKLKAQCAKWISLYDSLNLSLKELGDIVNWAEIIENDMQKVSAAVSKILTDS